MRRRREASDGTGLGEVSQTLEALERWGSSRGWLGSDPYEGLNATRVPGGKRSALGRRLLIQAIKRSPIDLRGLLGVPARHNALAVASTLSAYARPSSLDPAPIKLGQLLALLDSLDRSTPHVPPGDTTSTFRLASSFTHAAGPTPLPLPSPARHCSTAMKQSAIATCSTRRAPLATSSCRTSA